MNTSNCWTWARVGREGMLGSERVLGLAITPWRVPSAALRQAMAHMPVLRHVRPAFVKFV